MNRLARRDFLKTSSALAAASLLPGCAMEPAAPSRPIGRVIVIGGGFGGATAAKYLRMWSEGTIEVFLIERNAEFISCPTSNLVLGGTRTLADITRSYAKLREHGVQVLRDEATGINVEKKRVSLKRIEDLPYDRLIVSPAVDFMHEQIEGYDAEAQKTILHAWKAGPETVALRQQLEAMPDGGVCVIGVPRSPFRCPPGPYERACQIASYFKKAKPRSKVIVLDANEDIVSKPALFKAAWNDLYKGAIEYRGNNEVKAVDARAKTVKTDFDTIKGDVLNVLPPMRAGDIARTAGLLTPNTRWCGVDWLSMESTVHKGVHVLGDATLAAPAMPKSGHMANNHGKLAAAAIIELMNGRAPNPQPVIANTCYSFVSDKEVIHVASVHRYDPAQKTLTVVPGASGVSSGRSEIEGGYGWAWAQNIWSDMLG
ncbi:MAG: NAD(P)/FAD-dependent oxidoreductase [Betaproteobacteria bacterium]|nr:MAG: NAD(P)/FAD-dependent oxidoreductase [Betaproteobacteria bacterium]